MTLSLEVAGRDVVIADEVIDRSIRSRTSNDGSQGVLDFTLINPLVIPQNFDGVILHDGDDLLYEGEVRSVSLRQFENNLFLDVSCQDDNEGGDLPGAAPYGLSDNPDDVTTIGFRSMTLRRESTSGDEDTQITAVIYEPGFLPGMNVEVTNGNYSLTAEEMTIQQVGVVWPVADVPEYTLEIGDAVVRLAQVVNEVPDGSITETKISDSAITTPKLAAGSVTAETLESELVLATLIKTAESGARLELDSDGLRSYDSDEDLLVHIPTDDDQPVYVNAQVEAVELLVTGDATLRGDGNVFDASSVTTLASYQAAPSQAPALSQGWPQSTLTVHAAILGSTNAQGGANGYYDALGGADGATPCYVLLYASTVREYRVSDGELDRSTTLPDAIYGHGSITRLGAHWYISTHGGGDDVKIAKHARSDGSLVALSADLDGTVTPGRRPGLTTDGTSLYLVYNSSSSDLIGSVSYKRLVVNTSLSITDTDSIPMPTTPSGSPTHVRLVGAVIVNEDAGGLKLYLTFNWYTGSGSVVTYNYTYDTLATPAVVANQHWLSPDPPSHSTPVGNLIWDGTDFFQMIKNSATLTIYTYQDWDNGFTAFPTQTFWVAYSWYDNVATTHETPTGPRASIVLDWKKTLYVQTATIPGAGGADEPNRIRTYFLPSVSEPTAGTMELQTTSTSTNLGHSEYTTALTNDVTSNEFSTIADPAVLQSTAAGWALYGNGLMNLGGTSFPAGPATADQFFRTDLDLMFFYDGTRWLSTTLYSETSTIGSTAGATIPYTATTAAGVQRVHFFLLGGSNIWLEDCTTNFFVGGGTALSGSHMWVLTGTRNPSATSLGTLATINSGSSDVWRKTTVAIDALLTATDFEVDFVWTKTGTPGSLFTRSQITYRIVAA